MTISDELAVDLFRKYGKEFKQGEILFREGDKADEMYIIISGNAKIVKNLGREDREKSLAIVGGGEILGEMAIINSEVRSASVVIEETARILVIDRATFYAMIRNNAEFAMEFLRILSDRLREANARANIESLVERRARILHYFVNWIKDQKETVYSIASINALIESKMEIKPEQITLFIDNLVRSGYANRENNHLTLIDKEALLKMAAFIEKK